MHGHQASSDSRASPFKHIHSQPAIVAARARPRAVPKMTRNLSPGVSRDEYEKEFSRNVEKFQRKPRRPDRICTADPSDLQLLTEKGYKVKAERLRRKKKARREQLEKRMAETGEEPLMRGDPGYVSSSSASELLSTTLVAP